MSTPRNGTLLPTDTYLAPCPFLPLPYRGSFTHICIFSPSHCASHLRISFSSPPLPSPPLPSPPLPSPVHQNYLGYDAERAPFFLSMVFADGLYRCILWQRTVRQCLVMHTRTHMQTGTDTQFHDCKPCSASCSVCGRQWQRHSCCLERNSTTSLVCTCSSLCISV